MGRWTIAGNCMLRSMASSGRPGVSVALFRWSDDLPGGLAQQRLRALQLSVRPCKCIVSQPFKPVRPPLHSSSTQLRRCSAVAAGSAAPGGEFCSGQLPADHQPLLVVLLYRLCIPFLLSHTKNCCALASVCGFLLCLMCRGVQQQLQPKLMLPEQEAASDPDNIPPRSRLFLVVPKTAEARLIHVRVMGQAGQWVSCIAAVAAAAAGSSSVVVLAAAAAAAIISG